jgi:hypothetical protein
MDAPHRFSNFLRKSRILAEIAEIAKKSKFHHFNVKLAEERAYVGLDPTGS